MGENLKKFVDLYSKKVDAALQKSEKRLNEFTKLREKSITSTTEIGGEFGSLGKMVEAMFPKDGGLDSSVFARYSQLEIQKEERDSINSLFKLRNAPITNKKMLELKANGGESFFNEVRSEIGKQIVQSRATGSNISFDKITGVGSQLSNEEKINNFNDFIEILPLTMEAPGDVSTELYFAIVEAGDPTGTSAEPTMPSPINQEEQKKTEGVPLVSAVNPEEAAAEETEAQANIGQVTTLPPNVPVELTEAKETTVNVNLEQPETSPINAEKIAETAAEITTPTPVNIEETSPAINVNLESPASSAIKTEKTEIFKSEPTGIDLAIKNLLKGKVSPTELSSINLAKPKEESSLAKIEKQTETETISTSINLEKEQLVSEKASTDAKQMLSKYLSINLGGTKTAAPSSAKTGTTNENITATPTEMVESTGSSISMEEVELTKSSPKLEMPISSKEPGATTVQTTASESKIEEKSSEVIKSETTKPESSKQQEATEKASTPSNKGTDAAMLLLDARLARLEYLLSNTLEVKIIE